MTICNIVCGVISPLLANLYLHYTLDIWFERCYRKTCTGMARLIRYADDFVVCFQYEGDAKYFRQQMEVRLSQFGLEVAPDKTRILEFGPYAQQKARARGEKAATFDFLGLTHYCARSRNGKHFRMKRKTMSKRFTAKLKAYKTWLKANRTLTTPDIMRITAAKLRGHYGYYGVTDNGKCLANFAFEVRRILLKWLGRRGKRKCYNIEKFNLLLNRYPLPHPRTMVNLW